MSEYRNPNTPPLRSNWAEEFKVVVHIDGTNSKAEVVVGPNPGGEWQVWGTGKARRRKGDRRNDDVGHRLAVARALKNAAETARQEVEEMGYEV